MSKYTEIATGIKKQHARTSTRILSRMRTHTLTHTSKHYQTQAIKENQLLSKDV